MNISKKWTPELVEKLHKVLSGKCEKCQVKSKEIEGIVKGEDLIK